MANASVSFGIHSFGLATTEIGAAATKISVD
ncbi:hypothetical protein K227x_48840 [Rubripirellula lacrimiformis]|uniref:Uncharacterized protein n=1 Tax=Rubripirellula lacrimiformis TaxID=1930273 RepID=A0A517NH67_9BACT|nr:hypothetical protein K227x_48840 [Rubripirellula lacrimiformis]